MSHLDSVIGHTAAVDVLSRMIDRNSLPHALLFIGPESVGKTTVAHALVKDVMGYEGDLTIHPDVHVLERLTDQKTGKQKTQISVKQVREVVSKISMSPMIAQQKVLFIEEAHALSSSAANALLKTLEEPKGDALFILRAGSTESLPATIVSRCQILRFQQVSRDVMKDALKKLGFGNADTDQATAQALGRPGRAIRFLKDSSYRSDMDTGIGQAIAFFEQDLTGRLGQVTELIPKREVHKKRRLLVLLDQWELVLRDALFSSVGCDSWRTFPKHEELSRVTSEFSQEQLVNLLERVADVRKATRHHVNPHLALEHISLAL